MLNAACCQVKSITAACSQYTNLCPLRRLLLAMPSSCQSHRHNYSSAPAMLLHTTFSWQPSCKTRTSPSGQRYVLLCWRSRSAALIVSSVHGVEFLTSAEFSACLDQLRSWRLTVSPLRWEEGDFYGWHLCALPEIWRMPLDPASRSVMEAETKVLVPEVTALHMREAFHPALRGLVCENGLSWSGYWRGAKGRWSALSAMMIQCCWKLGRLQRLRQ
jgi:hypothetical protein